jgi:hypothetical protein
MAIPDNFVGPTPEALVARALEVATEGPQGQEGVDALIAAAGDDRLLLEAARDQMARRVRASVDDWDATAALTLLNRTLSLLPRHDPLDWRVRWTQRFRKP